MGAHYVMKHKEHWHIDIEPATHSDMVHICALLDDMGIDYAPSGYETTECSLVNDDDKKHEDFPF